MAKSRARKLADIIVGAGIDIDGNLTFDGGSTSADLTFADNDKANFGDASDLQIYHSGTDSIIKDSGIGGIKIDSNYTAIRSADGSETSAKFLENGAVELYHDNSKKFETTSTGATVTGQLTASTNLIATTATYSPIVYGGSSNLQLKSNTAEMFAQFVNNGAAELYYDNSKKFETFSAGVSVTGQLNATTMHLPDGSTGLQIGSSNDLTIFHDGTDSFIKNDTGQLILRVASVESALVAVPNGAVSLYYDNSAKLATTSTGIDVTGTITGDDGLSIQGGTGNAYLQVGSDTGSWTWKNYRSTHKLALEDSDGTGEVLNFNTNGNATFAGTITAEGGELYLGAADTASAHINSYEVMTFNIDSDNDDTNRHFAWYANGNSGSGNHLMRLTENGQLAIGTQNPSRTLHIRDSGQIKLESTSTGSWTGLDFAGGSGSYDMYMGMLDSDGRFFIDVDSNGEDFTILQNGNVGIGTQSPAEKLQINGNLRMFSAGYPLIDIGITTSNYFRFLHDNPTDIFKIGKNGAATLNISGSGNVGIGTSPAQKLDVNGKIRFTPNTADTNYSADIGALYNSTHPFELSVKNNGSSAEYLGVYADAGGANNRVVFPTGNVGIGTTSPTAPLSIRKVHATGYGSGIDMLDFKAYYPPNYDTETSKATIFVGTSDKHVLNTHGGYLAFRVNQSGYAGTSGATNLAEVMRIEKDGNVGIGTTSPDNKLHVKAGASGATSFDSRYNTIIEDNGENYLALYTPNNSFSGVRFVNADSSIRGYIDYYHGTQGDKMQIYAQNQIEFYYPTYGLQHTFKKQGNVGIRASNAPHDLTIYNASGPTLYLVGGSYNDDVRIAFGGGDTTNTSGNGNTGAQIISSQSAVGGQAKGNLQFKTNGGDLLETRLVIEEAGNVGIRNTNPSSNLTIGSAQSDGLEFTYDGTNAYRNRIVNYWNSNSDTRMDFDIGRTGGAAPTTVMSVGYNNNVGIGTTNPNSKLEVANPSGAGNGSAQEVGRFVNTASGATSMYLYLGASTGTDWRLGKNVSGISNNTNFSIADNGGTRKFDLTPDGTVGLGTTTPITPSHKTSTVTAAQSTSNGWSISTSGTYSARGAIEVAGITNRHIGKFGLSGNFSANTWYPIVKRSDLVSMAGNTESSLNGGFGVYFRIYAYTSSIGGGEYLANRVTETIWITDYGSNSNQTHEMRVGAGFGHAPNTGHDADDPSLCPIRMRIAHHYGSDSTWGNQQTIELNLDYALTGADPAAAGKQLIVYAYMI